MNIPRPAKRLAASLLVISTGMIANAGADESDSALPIDLSATLRLAGADNIEIQLAIERSIEAKALHEQAVTRFFPWIQPSAAYRRHDGNIQEVGGTILDVNKQSYSAGLSLNARLDFGEAIYHNLSARQLARAANEDAEAQRHTVIAMAASSYIQLARYRAAVDVARQSVTLAEELARQVTDAVRAGIAFKGDQHRAEGRALQNKRQLAQAEADRRVAAARLARILRLDPCIDLAPDLADLTPLPSTDMSIPVSELAARARTARAEIAAADARVLAARAERDGIVMGSWIPSIDAQAHLYGLGGGKQDSWGDFDDGRDYLVGVSWRIGPGGLFDPGRRRAAESRQTSAELVQQILMDDIAREVVEAHARTVSTVEQVTLAQAAMESAEETLRLTRERREFGIGAVLEAIQAQEDLTAARGEYLRVVADAVRHQFELRRAIGAPGK